MNRRIAVVALILQGLFLLTMLFGQNGPQTTVKPAPASAMPTKADREQFAKQIETEVSKTVGHRIETATGGQDADGIVIKDTAIQEAKAGAGFFNKDVGVQLARLGFQKVFVTNGQQWWCDVPDADSDTGWWKPMGLGGPFKSGNEAADMVAALWPIYIAGKKAPASNPSQNTRDEPRLGGYTATSQTKGRAFVDPPLAPGNLPKDNPNGVAVFMVASSKIVTIGNTDANGYRYNEGPPLQRVLGVFADGGTVDLLCYGSVVVDGVGSTTREGACPKLQVGKKYIMQIGRFALSYDRPSGDSVNWQVLEVCAGQGKPDPYGMHVAGGRGGTCQAVSTIHDR